VFLLFCNLGLNIMFWFRHYMLLKTTGSIKGKIENKKENNWNKKCFIQRYFLWRAWHCFESHPIETSEMKVVQPQTFHRGLLFCCKWRLYTWKWKSILKNPSLIQYYLFFCCPKILGSHNIHHIGYSNTMVFIISLIILSF